MSLSRFLSAWARCGLLVWLWLGVGPVAPVAAQHGCDPGNLIPNCDFDAFYGSPLGEVPEGWVPFVLSGSLEFKGTSGSESHSFYVPSSLRMRSDGGIFVAGIYTQVGGLQPGVTYKASIGWGAPNEPDAFGRKLGIDPTGGADPNSPTVVWGPPHYGSGRMLNYPWPELNIDISAVAQTSTVTVFVYVDHNYSTGDNFIFIDAVSLFVDPVQPAPTPAPPTATPVPPRPTATATATAMAAPTATPEPPATPTATATPTDTPTPTAIHTPTVTPTPTQTLTPIATATSTLPPRPTATPALIQAYEVAAAAAAPRGLLWGGLGVLGGAGLLGVAWTLARRR